MNIRQQVGSFSFVAAFLSGVAICLAGSWCSPVAAAATLQSAVDESASSPSQDGAPAAAAAPAAEQARPQEPLAAASAQQLIQDLSAAAFAQRQAAAQGLRQHIGQPEVLRLISTTLQTETQPERMRRLVELVEEAFRAADSRSAAAALTAEMLEQAAVSDKWYLSEAAQGVLERQWRRRVEVAVLELRRLGVPLDPADPQELWKAENAPQQFPADPGLRQFLKIYIDEHWPTDPRAFTLLGRLKGLGMSSRLGGGLISIYRLEGHPLSVEQTAFLKGIFGDFRVQDRGRVCLGVTSGSQGAPTGVLIGDVQRGSSADKAGLKPGDFVTSLNGTPLSGFEELVTLLRDYKVGDKVTLRVQKLPSDEFPMFQMQGRRMVPVPQGGPGIPRPIPMEAPKKGAPAPNDGPDKSPEDSSKKSPDAAPDGSRDVEVVLQGWYDKSSLLRPVDNPQ